MKPLEGYLVGFVAHEPATAPRAETLRKAGATVRVSSPQLDLWTALGEGTFDALVLPVSAGEPSTSAILAALDGDPRTRTIPVLVLSEPGFATELVRAVTSTSIVILSAEAPDGALVGAVVKLASTERALRDLEDEHRMQLEQLRSTMARADSSRTELNNVAHDLRALLGIAFGFACNLRDEVVGPLSAEQRDHVMRILDASRDATGLIDRAQDSARVPRVAPTGTMRPESARPNRVQRTLVDLAELASSVKTLFEQMANGQSKRLRYHAEQVSVWGDALKLKQVLVNLVGNAVKYCPPGGEIGIIVRWGRPTETVGPGARKRGEIVVTNTGSGIPTESRKRIFERGFRLDEHAHLPGQGVGLSIVQEVVAQHGGTVRANGRPGEGAEFTVSLPTDMRVRDRDLGVLLVPESEAASVLIDAIRSARPDELVAMMADRPREFLDLVAACGAFVVVPRDKTSPLSEALSEILTPFNGGP